MVASGACGAAFAAVAACAAAYPSRGGEGPYVGCRLGIDAVRIVLAHAFDGVGALGAPSASLKDRGEMRRAIMKYVRAGFKVDALRGRLLETGDLPDPTRRATSARSSCRNRIARLFVCR
jgi:hypothetical protein